MEQPTPFHAFALYMSQDWRDRVAALLRREAETILRLVADAREGLQQGGRPNEAAWNAWMTAAEAELWPLMDELESAQGGIPVEAQDMDARLTIDRQTASRAFRSNDFLTFIATWETYAQGKLEVANELAALQTVEIEPWQRTLFETLWAKIREQGN